MYKIDIKKRDKTRLKLIKLKGQFKWGKLRVSSWLGVLNFVFLRGAEPNTSGTGLLLVTG